MAAEARLAAAPRMALRLGGAAEALREFNPSSKEGYLSVRPGDSLTVLHIGKVSSDEAGWVYASRNNCIPALDKEGWVPAANLDEDIASGDDVIVLRDVAASAAGYLEAHCGERLLVLHRGTSASRDAGWLYVERRARRHGAAAAVAAAAVGGGGCGSAPPTPQAVAEEGWLERVAVRRAPGEHTDAEGKADPVALLMSLQADLEVWRLQLPQPAELRPRPHLVQLVQDALRSRVPQDHYAECGHMRQVVVTSVDEVINTQIWKQYLLKRQQTIDALSSRWNCPWVRHIAPAIDEIHQALNYMRLEPNANEVLLFHGTEDKNVSEIVQQGFDERLSHRNLYGRGIYLTPDACKVAKYATHGRGGCIIIARAILGHPYSATGPMKNHDRPPHVEGLDEVHDSTIAQPGIPHGKGKANGKGKQQQGFQTHWEIVVPDAQLYPDLIVRFKCDE